MSTAPQPRNDAREYSAIRPVRILANTSPYAEGSAEVVIGATRLLITASIDAVSEQHEDHLIHSGGIVANLQMLPRATHLRIRNPLLREALQQELKSIQDLVVRSLRAATIPAQLQNCTITLDISVVCSDGGIATAAVAGSWVALAKALSWATAKRILSPEITISPVAALSGGLLRGAWCLDLSAEEASAAECIVNMVFDEEGKLLDLKATRETGSMDIGEISTLLSQASSQTRLLIEEQKNALQESR